MKELRELEDESIRMILFTEVEEGFGLGTLVVGGGHEMGD